MLTQILDLLNGGGEGLDRRQRTRLLDGFRAEHAMPWSRTRKAQAYGRKEQRGFL
jgi:hypothetical protein